MTPRFLVTAGNTRERIDQVRDWGNIFTGNTGFSIAKALAGEGAVDLLTSNGRHLAEVEAHPEFGIAGTPFSDHADLRRTLARLMRKQYSAVFMSAAVSDYSPAGAFAVTVRETLQDGTERWIVRNAQAGKVKSTVDEIAFLGRKTEKLVDLFRTAWGFKGLLVKFKLEVGLSEEELIRIGEQSRKASGADYLVANTLEMVRGETPGAFVIGAGGAEWVERDQLPEKLRQIVRNSPQ